MTISRMLILSVLFIAVLLAASIGTASASVVYTGTSWDTTSSGNNNPLGITMNDTYFWIADGTEDEVYQYYHNGTYTGTSWDTASSGNNNPLGITMNDTYFWIADGTDDEVYQYYHNGTYTGTSWDTASSGNDFPLGITMNDTYFWIVDNTDDEVYQYYHNGTYTGTSWDTASSGNNYPFGITMNDTYFWIVDNIDDEVYQYYDNTIPLTPTLISPSNNSVHTSSLHITLNVSSTDADSHTITYYFYAGTSPTSMSFIGNNDLIGGNSFNWSISQYDEYYWTARAYDGYEYSSNMTTAQFTLITPTNLTSPANTSTIYMTYPPLTYDTTFTWQNTGAPSYRLVVAEDANFNIIKVDTTIGTSTSTHSLVVNEQYFWKVYSYDGSIFSDSSDIYSFNLTGNSTLTGSAIEGSVYHNADGYTLITGAEVIIWNATWSDSAVTGSNGYYVFTDLTAGQVYSLQAKADRYLDSSIAIITADTDPITKNFYLLDDLTDTEWWWYVSFILQSLNGTRYSDVVTTVYIGDAVTPYATGITGDDGAVVFHLDKHVKYRITFIDAAQGISETRTLYPLSNQYYIYIDGSLTFEPGNVSTELTNYTTNYTTRPWSIQNMTAIELNSSIGLGLLGQGIIASIVLWVVVGAGGPVTGFACMAGLCMMGVISWVMLLFVGMCCVSIAILGSKIQ